MKYKLLSILTLLIFIYSCQNSDKELKQKYNEGRNIGYNNGFEQGKVKGYEEGKKHGFDQGFIQGKENGLKEGHLAGKQEGYIKGQEEGLKKGLANADEVSFNKGINEGYERGFADAVEGKTTQQSYLQLLVKQFDRQFVEIFSLVCFILNCIVLLLAVVSLTVREPNDRLSVFGKSLSIMFGLLIAIVVINQSILFNLVDVDIEKSWQIWLMIIIAIAVFGISYLLREILDKYDNLYSYFFIIGFSAIILSFFTYFIFNIKVFLLENEFVSDLMIAISLGGLVFGMNTIVKIRNNVAQQNL